MKKIVVISIVLAALFVIVYFIFRSGKPGDPHGSSYAGSLTCLKCHSELYKSYLHTAHYIASSPASLKTVHGSFSSGFNVFEINSKNR